MTDNHEFYLVNFSAKNGKDSLTKFETKHDPSKIHYCSELNQLFLKSETGDILYFELSGENRKKNLVLKMADVLKKLGETQKEALKSSTDNTNGGFGGYNNMNFHRTRDDKKVFFFEDRVLIIKERAAAIYEFEKSKMTVE